MYDRIRKTAFPIFAAMIWGAAFVAQKNNTTGALTFNMSRSVIAFLFLLPVILIFTKGDIRHILGERTKKETRTLWIGGVCCGLALSAATFLQQIGLDSGTEAGKASFLTAMYIVIVPVFGLVLGKKAPVNVWISVAIAVAGLYLLCVKGKFEVRPSDVYVAACSLLFSVHILLIDHFSARCSGLKLSCIQFLTSAVVSGIGALAFEEPSWSGIAPNLGAILYLGVFSSGVAYTLQIIAQRDANPTVMTLLLSMESVFGVVSGAIFLHEVMSVKEYIGCVLMLAAVILAQLPVKKMLERRRSGKKKDSSSI
ncbi:MAG: DMT family transporter [Clostridiales bacterium]|nr:DMT family transporter [Clostridiales bacterium]